MLRILYEDFKRCMQLSGCNKISDITKTCLARVSVNGPLERL